MLMYKYSVPTQTTAYNQSAEVPFTALDVLHSMSSSAGYVDH